MLLQNKEAIKYLSKSIPVSDEEFVLICLISITEYSPSTIVPAADTSQGNTALCDVIISGWQQLCIIWYIASIASRLCCYAGMIEIEQDYATSITHILVNFVVPRNQAAPA